MYDCRRYRHEKNRNVGTEKPWYSRVADITDISDVSFYRGQENSDVLTLYEALPVAGRIVNKGGGEYCGPCPACGGKDRFILWPEHQSGAKGGRFLCRGCGAQGDAVEFLRVFRGMTYPEACEALRIEPSRRNGHPLERHTAKEWIPAPENFPPAVWMEQATAFVHECAAGIESGPGLEYLQSRGLSPETARALGIGWNPADRYDRRADWGLSEEQNPDTGRFRKVWFPRGLVLPIRRKSGVTALLIRRADWRVGDDLPKYWQIKGSGNGCYVIGKPGIPVVLVESVLDAVLIWQEARDLVASVAITGATKKPDEGTTAFLRQSPLLLWSLDFDAAGLGAWNWWQEHFPGVKAWPCAAGKDPGDMVNSGIPIRLWINASLPCEETRQNAPCEANRTEDESQVMIPLRSKSEASETPQPGPLYDVGTDTQDDAVACPQYPSDCLACPEYRGMMRWWCRKFHWWKPWPMPGTGELPTVTIHRGHVRHVYQDGTTRLVGLAAAPTVPASVMPPVPNQAAAPMTRAERWHEAAKGALC